MVCLYVFLHQGLQRVTCVFETGLCGKSLLHTAEVSGLVVVARAPLCTASAPWALALLVVWTLVELAFCWLLLPCSISADAITVGASARAQSSTLGGHATHNDTSTTAFQQGPTTRRNLRTWHIICDSRTLVHCSSSSSSRKQRAL